MDQDRLVELLDRRAMKIGMLRCTEVLLRQYVVDLDNIEATIRVLDPGCDLEIVPKPPSSRCVATKWQALTPIVAVLRKARKPITAAEIARRIMIGRGMPTTDQRSVRLMIRRVGGVLRDHRRRGVVQSSGPQRGPMLWRLLEVPPTRS